MNSSNGSRIINEPEPDKNMEMLCTEHLVNEMSGNIAQKKKYYDLTELENGHQSVINTDLYEKIVEDADIMHGTELEGTPEKVRIVVALFIAIQNTLVHFRLRVRLDSAYYGAFNLDNCFANNLTLSKSCSLPTGKRNDARWRIHFSNNISSSLDRIEGGPIFLGIGVLPFTLSDSVILGTLKDLAAELHIAYVVLVRLLMYAGAVDPICARLWVILWRLQEELDIQFPVARFEASMSVSKNKQKAVALMLLQDQILQEEIEILYVIRSTRRSPSSQLFKRRSSEGAFKLLIHRHLLDDEVKFKEYFRFTRQQFSFLLDLVQDDLGTEPYNRVRNPISAAEKLGLTLRFLATGESFRSLAFGYRISSSTISNFIPIVLKVLKTKLQSKFLPPVSQINWKEKAEQFWMRWNFPNCLAGLDGKHVKIVAPNNTGSLFYNYKNYFSIFLLAMVDANCKFVGIDVGSYGKEGDAGFFNKSEMGQQISNGTFFPPPQDTYQVQIFCCLM
ncbi:hypothetical protein NQ318_023239 [Aromia moschata]|uniref:DDE Tnp4 domain-containing protein n=1 Tax=Aromia moschata TaxID=1265417 RepID=A0AAV8XNH5_9CUCU|nr:hypothetical protein NQ318_023239 [Aromia moschata]